MTRCLSASGLNCLRPSAILCFLSPFAASPPPQFREGVIWGASSLYSLCPVSARPPELGLQIVTCVKQHLIWSRGRRCPCVRYPFLVFLQTRAICLRQKEGSGAHWRSRRRWWPLKSLRKVGIVGFGIERCLGARGGSGGEGAGAENQNTELSIAPSVRTPERPKPRKKEVRTICLAERHQLVWPALPFCQAPGNQSKMNSSPNCSPFSLSLLSDSASRPRDAPLNKTASFNACLSQ